MESGEVSSGESKIAHLAKRVSVVVPSYNHGQFIGTCLRSITRQSLAPSELLVIDDGSTDGSLAVIEEFLKDSPFPCELVARSNRGLCATLNEGLARTHGEYFAYLGSDDLWLRDFLECRVATLEKRTRAVLCYGHAYLIDDLDRVIDSTEEWADYADGDVRAMLLAAIAPMSPTVVYRRNVLERHGWYEGVKLEDYDLYLRLCSEGEFAFDPRTLSAWRRHGNNTSWDQEFMLGEQLRAQRAAAERLGIEPNELQRLQTVLKFNRAEDFLRLGQKRAAASLVFHNLTGIRHLGSAARMLVRFLLPYKLMQRHKNNQQIKAHKRYGSIRL
jgi:alpha-1,3-rhamnosyltransferase